MEGLVTVQLHRKADGKIVHVRASGKLTAEDYERLVPEFEDLVARHDKLRLFFEMEDFEGWKTAALWEDTKLAFKHFQSIERIAMVGEKRWQEGMATFCKPFTSADIRYFEHHEKDDAWEWIHEGVAARAEERKGQVS
jgi:hypothetical protein